MPRGPDGADEQIDRGFDHGAPVVGRPERIGSQDAMQQRQKVEVAVAQDLRQALDLGVVLVEFRHHVAPELAGDEAGGTGLFQHKIKRSFGAEPPPAAKEADGAGVVIPGVECESEIAHAIDAIAGEGTGQFAHGGLVVIAFAQNEEFHHLAGEVFVGVFASAVVIVEIHQQGRVPQHRLCQHAEVDQTKAAEGLVLAQHGVGHLVDTRVGADEMVVPEQRHALDLRGRGLDHLPQPPGAQL